MPHDPLGATKLKDFHFTAWVQRRFHHDDASIPRGQFREPDMVLELRGPLSPETVMVFLEDAALSGRQVHGVLIAVHEEDG